MKCYIKSRIIKYALFTLFLFTSLIISSCSKEEDSNPVVEQTVSVTIIGDLIAYNGIAYTYSILKADLLFDGNVIASANFTTGSNHAYDLTGTVNSVKKGTHTISFRMTTQTSSPNFYGTYDVKVTAGNSTFDLDHIGATLETGESISYSITI